MTPGSDSCYFCETYEQIFNLTYNKYSRKVFSLSKKSIVKV